MTALFLLAGHAAAGLAAAGLSFAAPAQPTQITTTGWCSPVFVNVSGPVSVTCKGVDPQANAALNRQLDALKLSQKETVQQANEWAERYHTLQKKFAQETSGNELARKAEDYLHQGDLDHAILLLKQLAAGKDKQNVDDAARRSYEIALALEMEFKTPEALPYLEEAQQLRPNEFEYACEYGRALIKENRLDDAKAVYDRILPKLDELQKTDVNLARFDMIALDDAGGLYASLGDDDKARDAYNRASAHCFALALLPQSPKCDLYHFIGIVTKLGTLQVKEENYEQAENTFTTAFNEIKAGATEKEPLLREQANLLTELGFIYQNESKFDQAESALAQAQAVQNFKLDQRNPEIAAETAETSFVLGGVERSQHYYKEADQSYRQSAEKLRELVKQDPDAYLPRLERTLIQWAESDMEAKATAQAAPVYVELIPVEEKLAATNPGESLPRLANAYDVLASLHSSASLFPEAVRYRKLAADTVRRMQESPSKPAQLANTLAALAWDAAQAKDVALAQSSIDEAEQILRDLYKQDAAAYGEPFGRALVFQAMLLQSVKQDCDAASRKLTEATQASSAPVVVNAAKELKSTCPPASP